MLNQVGADRGVRDIAGRSMQYMTIAELRDGVPRMSATTKRIALQLADAAIASLRPVGILGRVFGVASARQASETAAWRALREDLSAAPEQGVWLPPRRRELLERGRFAGQE